MSDIITIIGTVATAPNTVKTDGGLAITHFRLASNNRRFDRSTQGWVDGDSNFYSVSAFRQTAHNVLASLTVGDRVVVTGKLKLKEWTSGDRRGVTAEIDVDALGHDLTWGRSVFTKVSRIPDRQAGETEGVFPATADVSSPAMAGVNADGGQSDDEADNTPEADEAGFDTEGAGADARTDGDDSDHDDESQGQKDHDGEVDVARASAGLFPAPAPF
jgi:single-strand DNA-binding protein